jgi:hypothetical protein
MTMEIVERRFAEIGARVKATGPPVGDPRIDVRPDRRGEFFDVRFAGGVGSVELEVVDVDRAGQEQVPVRLRRAALVRSGRA